MKRLHFTLFIFFLLGFTATKAQNPGHSMVTPEGAWCWFADPRALYHESADGKIRNTYIGYIDTHGIIKATQYNHRTKVREEVLIRSYFQPDDHNNPTFLVLPDDRVMIFYSRHTDEACFYYRISQKPGDITSLGNEKRLETAHKTTYPSPFILSDDPTHIYLCWRGIKWHPTIARLTLPDAEDNVSFDWEPRQLVQSTAARPYAKYASNGKDKIYLTYTTGHPDVENPNWVYFNYINVNKDTSAITLTDVRGKVLSTINAGPLQINKEQTYADAYPAAVVNRDPFRNWVWQVSFDPSGNPVIAMTQIDDSKDHHSYHHVRWNGQEWVKTFLTDAGGHFHQTPDLEKCYSGGMAIDESNTNIIYGSVPVEGKHGKVYEIIQYSLSTTSPGEVSNKQLTHDSQENNVRPYYITHSAQSKDGLRLAWMNGKYYDWIVSNRFPKGFPTAIHAAFAFPQPKINLKKGLAKDSKGLKKFTLAFTLEGVKEEPIYSFEGITIYNEYLPSNILATGDNWKNHTRGTSGKWFEPYYHPSYNVALTYDGTIFTSYINGLIVQRMEIKGLTADNIKLNEAHVKNLVIYSRALSQAEVKAEP